MQKPTSMMVTGILNIAFASLGVLMAIVGLASAFLPLPGTEPARELYKDGTFLLTVVVLGGVGFLSKLAMAGSGLGLVKGKAWGRSLGNGWAVFSMVYGLANVVVQATYIMPKSMAAQRVWMQNQPSMNSPAGQQQMQMMQGVEDITLVVTIVSGVIFALAYQAVFLFLNNRKPVRDYLAEQG